MTAEETFTVEPFDPATASDADLAAYHDLGCAHLAEELPDDPSPPVEETVLELQNPSEYSERRRWVVRSADGSRLDGYSTVTLTRNRDDNRHLAEVWTYVRPERRRQGLGARLTQPALAAAIADGRTLVDLWSRNEGPAEGYLSRLGAEKRMVERISRLRLDEVDRALLDRWVKQAEDRAVDYELIRWDGGVPEEHREAFAELSLVMNTAPREDLEMEDWQVTAAMVEEWDRRAAARGLTSWLLVARQRSTGELAGYSAVIHNRHRPWELQQGDTGVWPHHRERGLGRWLKAAMLQRILDELPDARWIDTGNAGSNRPMLAINDELGFRPVLWWGGWQVPVEVAADRVAGMIRG